jgi:ATP-dependent DNA ligase
MIAFGMLFQSMPLVRGPSRLRIRTGFQIPALFPPGGRAARFVERKYTFESFLGLCEGLAPDLKGRRCVLDCEIVCLDSKGKPRFRDLLLRHTGAAVLRL